MGESKSYPDSSFRISHFEWLFAFCVAGTTSIENTIKGEREQVLWKSLELPPKPSLLLEAPVVRSPF